VEGVSEMKSILKKVTEFEEDILQLIEKYKEIK
jgi:hypothetical protein